MSQNTISPNATEESPTLPVGMSSHTNEGKVDVKMSSSRLYLNYHTFYYHP